MLYAMSAMKCMSALHACLLKESMVAFFFAMFIAFLTFSIFGWVRISIAEPGAITLILFSSWAGADHSAPCSVAPAITCLQGPESDGLCCRTLPRCHCNND